MTFTVQELETALGCILKKKRGKDINPPLLQRVFILHLGDSLQPK
jgi:hypothetical protein